MPKKPVQKIQKKKPTSHGPSESEPLEAIETGEQEEPEEEEQDEESESEGEEAPPPVEQPETVAYGSASAAVRAAKHHSLR